MTDNTEALRLAELLEKNTWPTLEEQHKAAAELRRLAAENEALREQEPLGWAVQVGVHSAGRRQGTPRYVIFFNKSDAEALGNRKGVSARPFYLGGRE